MSSDDVQILTEAITDGEVAGLPEHDMTAIRERKAKVEEREAIRQSFQDLINQMKKLDIEDPVNLEKMKRLKEDLTAALKKGKQCGLSEAELKPVDAQRKKLHNAIEDLKGAIRVFCRVRPISKTEAARGDTACVKCTDKGVEIDHEHNNRCGCPKGG